MAAKWADKIIVLNRKEQTYFKEIYGRNTVFIPNGVSRPELVQADLIKQEFGLEKDSYMNAA